MAIIAASCMFYHAGAVEAIRKILKNTFVDGFMRCELIELMILEIK